MIIRVVDLETTGMAAPDAAPCEVAWVDLRAIDNAWEIDLFSMRSLLCNPSRQIPPEVSAVHHIVDEDVADKMFWTEALAACAAKDDPLFRPSAFAAHNAKFERQWLTRDVVGEAPVICTYKCALRAWPDAPSHSNQSLRYWLKPAGLDREIAAVAHRALPDAYVTAFTLIELLKMLTIEQLVSISSEPALLPKVRFGKHAGKAWGDVPSDYLQWCLRQDMDEDVIFTARHELSRR